MYKEDIEEKLCEAEGLIKCLCEVLEHEFEISGEGGHLFTLAKIIQNHLCR